jgi:DNA topoisomerase-2
MVKSKKKVNYDKKDLRTHIEDISDTYIGSDKEDKYETWILSKDTTCKKKYIKYVPGIYKIFDEIVVNAADHSRRDSSVKNIKINIDKCDDFINNKYKNDDDYSYHKITVYNDGNGIDADIHSKYNIYNLELIFGHLLTSSNYDKNIKKTWGGKNGYGAKLTNIFSLYFKCESVDVNLKKKVSITWTNNMKIKSDVKITDYNNKPYTKVEFIIDYKRFGIKKFSKNFLSFLYRRVYDICVCTPSKVNIYLDDEKLKYKSFKDYIKLYLPVDLDFVYEDIINDEFDTDKAAKYKWKIAVSFYRDNGYESISFVNGISTTNGGTHVDHITNQVIKGLTDEICRKYKDITIKPAFIKEHIWVFVDAIIEDPKFTSQVKEQLITKISDYGTKVVISEKFIKKLAKSGIMDEVYKLAQFKTNKNLKKTDGKKKKNLFGIPNFDDANKAGTSESYKCNLFLVEGLSAKALVTAGYSVISRNFNGVFPLKGKFINVKHASATKLANNAEFTNIKKIVGLKQDIIYDQDSIYADLRYGNIIVLTDSDLDGDHILGLITNMFHTYWKELINAGCLKVMITPIIKVTKKKLIHNFYTLNDYEDWKNDNNISGWKIKYYKGLGTSTPDEAKEYFGNLKNLLIDIKLDKDAEGNIKLAFSKGKSGINSDGPKYEDLRKEWLTKKVNQKNIFDFNNNKLSVSNMVNQKLIEFFKYDNERSLPSLLDGWKPSQRKVYYGTFKSNIKNEIKVAQLIGLISSKTAYHHGEQSLVGTVIGMAQIFVGSNNINSLKPNGGYGTRGMGGKDASSERYIFTALSEISGYIFKKEDNDILEQLYDDGQPIEYRFYLPIICMILVNGCNGIGTGFSTNVPQYNPKDIINNIRRLLKGKSVKKMLPFYKGFSGEIRTKTEVSYETLGIAKKKTNTVINILELPIGKWTQDYKNFLNKLISEKILIKSYDEYHKDDNIHFEITFKNKEELNELWKDQDKFYKTMKLTSDLSINNMHLHNVDGIIKKYTSPESILKEYFKIRLHYYELRRLHLIDLLKKEIQILSNRARFIIMQIDDELDIRNIKKKKVIQILENESFNKVYNSDDENGCGYDYLLGMNFWMFTKEKVDQLKKEKEKKEIELEMLKNKTKDDLWIDDLNDLEANFF